MPISFPHKPGLIAYLTAGDPDLATTRDIALTAIDNGADVIELGVPFSDPLADGPVIQRASERAVARGVRLTDVLALAADLRRARPNCGIVLFSYLNPVLQFGAQARTGNTHGYHTFAAFCAAAKDSGVDGVLLTDMIVEEAGDYLAAMGASQLAPIFLAAPTSPDARLKAIAEHTQGFVYAISRVGITGTRDSIESDAPNLVSRLRKFTQLPIAVGFGISNRDHVRAVGQFADAAIIGSAIVALIEKTEPAHAPAAVGKFIAELRA